MIGWCWTWIGFASFTTPTGSTSEISNGLGAVYNRTKFNVAYGAIMAPLTRDRVKGRDMAKTKRPRPKAKAPRDTSTMSVTPRTYPAGIYPLGWREPTDKEEVEKAIKHLRQLKRDPYYYEAMLRLSRKGELDVRRPGLLPSKVGELAGKLQRPQIARAPGKPGHPPHDDLKWLRDFSALIDRQPVKGSLKHCCQKLIQFFYSDAPSDAQSKLTTEIYEKLRAFRRRMRNK